MTCHQAWHEFDWWSLRLLPIKVQTTESFFVCFFFKYCLWIYFSFICMIFFLPIYMDTMYMPSAHRWQKRDWVSWSYICCKLPCSCGEPNPGPLQEQQVLLVPLSYLFSSITFFFKNNCFELHAYLCLRVGVRVWVQALTKVRWVCWNPRNWSQAIVSYSAWAFERAVHVSHLSSP